MPPLAIWPELKEDEAGKATVVTVWPMESSESEKVTESPALMKIGFQFEVTLTTPQETVTVAARARASAETRRTRERIVEICSRVRLS